MLALDVFLLRLEPPVALVVHSLLGVDQDDLRNRNLGDHVP